MNLNTNSFFENPLTASVFETMVAQNRVIFRMAEHLDRLWESAQTIGVPMELKREALEAELIQVARKCHNKKMCIRVAIKGREKTILTFERSLPASYYQDGIHLVTSATRRNASNAMSPEAKSNQFLNGILSLLDLTSGAAFETLILDRNGLVKEARVWNLFIVKRGTLETPATDGILNGVTRNFVIECALKEKIPVVETSFTRHEVWNSEEAFLTNTSGGILPVQSLDGRKIKSPIPGKITKQLSKRYKLEFEKEMSAMTFNL